MIPFVYDLETLSNCFTATFVAVDSDETHVFVIHESRNDFPAMLEFLQQEGLGLIGYNSINFDYPVLHDILVAPAAWTRMYEANEWDKMARMTYSTAQRIIEADYSAIAPWETLIPQRDVYKVHHFDNKNKRTSLKHIEVAIKWHDVMDMPISHIDDVVESQIEEILIYNLNDVLATKAFYLLTLDMLAMRRDLGRRYNLPLMNANDPKIGESIMLKYISERSNVEPGILKTLRTERESITLKDCLLPYVKFKTDVFNDVLNTISNTTVAGDKLKGAFDTKVYYDGLRYDFGLGGLHAVRESSIYHTNFEEQILIISLDVKSYYPNLAIRNNFYPAHLGMDFCHVYEQLYDERAAAPKGSAVNAGLKLALNGAYGKSNDAYSFLYDPMYTLKVTLNGQLLLAMLCEKITETGVGQILMVNTDGIEVKLHTGDIERLRTIVKNWEKLTNLILEEDTYRHLWIRDVNNYIAMFANQSIYTKGAYEWDGKAYHKDQSMLVVPRAVQEYFVNGTPILDTLHASTDLYEFCLSMRSAKGANFIMQTIHADENGNHDIHEERLQRTNRFIVTKKGGLLIKRFSDGKITRIRSPFRMQVYNLIIENDTPMTAEVDYSFYEMECYKLIYGIEHHQIDMFNG